MVLLNGNLVKSTLLINVSSPGKNSSKLGALVEMVVKRSPVEVNLCGRLVPYNGVRSRLHGHRYIGLHLQVVSLENPHQVFQHES